MIDKTYSIRTIPLENQNKILGIKPATFINTSALTYCKVLDNKQICVESHNAFDALKHISCQRTDILKIYVKEKKWHKWPKT